MQINSNINNLGNDDEIDVKNLLKTVKREKSLYLVLLVFLHYYRYFIL